MTKSAAALIVLALAAGNVFAGDINVMIREKAKGEVNQSDAQQGIAPQYAAPGAPSAGSGAPPAPSMPELTPEQQALLQLVNGLGALKEPATLELKHQLTDDLAGVARGSSKPSPKLLQKLANDLAVALAGKTPTVNQRGRMAKDIQTVLSGSPLPASQMEDVISDVPSILKRVGADAAAAGAVGDDLKAASAEIKKKG
jgi:hypothetical protein